MVNTAFALAGSALTALTWLAYRKPEEYSRLYIRIVIPFLLVGLVGPALFQFGNVALLDAAEPALKQEAFQKLSEVQAAMNISLWYYAIGNATLLYSIFLLFLPRILKGTPSQKSAD